MIVTYLFVYFLQLVHGSSVVDHNRCEFHLKIIIRNFQVYGYHWPGANPGSIHDANIQGRNTVINLLNKNYEMSLNLPGNISLLNDVILDVRKYKACEPTYLCQFEIIKKYNGSPQWEGQFNDITNRTDQCLIDVVITTTLQCPSTTKPTVINTSTVLPQVTRFNTSNVMMTSPAVGAFESDTTSAPGNKSAPSVTKENVRAVSMVWVWYITMSVAYFIAGVIVTVEVCFCCKMYQRARSFPWCRVRMPRAKANTQDTEHNNEVDRSVTLSLESKQPPKDQNLASTSQTVWIETDSQKNK